MPDQQNNVNNKKVLNFKLADSTSGGKRFEQKMTKSPKPPTPPTPPKND